MLNYDSIYISVHNGITKNNHEDKWTWETKKLLTQCVFVLLDLLALVMGDDKILCHDMDTLFGLIALCAANLPSQYFEALMFSSLVAWTNCWTKSGVANDLRRLGAHMMSL